MLLSIVIPCYNEEEVLPETFKRLQAFALDLKNSKNFDCELIFINDGSSDQTAHLIHQASLLNPMIKLISFSRNFGHEIATTAGIDHAQGDVVVLIDADLQDPPELIHEMIRKWEEGYDVVYGVRTQRLGESWSKRLFSKIFYRCMNYFSDTPIPLDTGDFRLMSREVVNAFKQLPERDRFIRGMVSWLGFKQIALPYDRQERFAGTTKYSFKKLLALAVTGIFSFSTRPLEFSVKLGFFFSFIAVLGVFYILGIRFLTDTWVPGWAGIMITILFMGGIQLISVGILGIYIGRIYNEVKRRPLYLTQKGKNHES